MEDKITFLEYLLYLFVSALCLLFGFAFAEILEGIHRALIH